MSAEQADDMTATTTTTPSGVSGNSAVVEAAARAVCASAAVAAYCVAMFGRPCHVMLDAYGAEGYPTEEDAPFVLVTRAGTESERGNVAESTFAFQVVAGINAAPGDGSAPDTVLVAGGANANTLTRAGNMALAERLRELAIEAIRAANIGTALGVITLDESDAIDFPLQWARAIVNTYKPNWLED